MTLLSQRVIVDLTAVLPRQACALKVRRPSDSRRAGPVTSLTLHYNGPAVSDRSAAGTRRQLVVDARYHQSTMGADGLQYHLVVDVDGTIYQTRDYGLIAWHAANVEANEHSLALHLPLGGTQDATAAQWQAITHLFDILIADYRLSGRQAVKGHTEWPRSDGAPQKSCPGPLLMARLRAWRAGAVPATGATTRLAAPGRYRVTHITFAHTARSAVSPIAWDGTARLAVGQEIDIDDITNGWAHWPAAGFIPLLDLEAI